MNQIQSTAYFCVAHKQRMIFASFRGSYEKNQKILIFYDTWKWHEIQMLASINEVILEHIRTHSWKCCLWALSCYSDTTEYLWQRHMVPKAWNIYYLVLRKFANLCARPCPGKQAASGDPGMDLCCNPTWALELALTLTASVTSTSELEK